MIMKNRKNNLISLIWFDCFFPSLVQECLASLVSSEYKAVSKTQVLKRRGKCVLKSVSEAVYFKKCSGFFCDIENTINQINETVLEKNY